MTRIRLALVVLTVLVSGWLVSPVTAQTQVWHWVNGVLRGPGFVTAGPVLNGDGTAAAPSYAFASEAGLGFYRPGANHVYLPASKLMGFGAYGVGPSVAIGSGLNGIELSSNASVHWSSTTSEQGVVDLTLSRLAADVVAPAAGDAYGLAAKAWIRTAPTISSGFGTSPSIVASNGTAAFTINVGTGGTANSGVIALPTATTGWAVACADVTTQSATVYLTKQTAFSTTTATIGNFDAAGAAAAWVASNILVCQATAF